MAKTLFEAGASDVLYLVDLSSYLLRAYHAVAPLSSPQGEPTHAVHGTITMLERLFRERKPALLGIALDSGRATFRREMYPEYKAQRPPAPDDLKIQIRRAEEIITAWGLACFKQDGVEADDLIASVTRRAREQDLRVVIVGADKDLMQLVSPEVQLYDTLRNKVFGPAEVEERFQVPPEKLGDLLALMGDSSDNIPGVPSVGPKTAADLIQQFGSLDGVFASLEEVKRKKLKETLEAHEDNARLSRRLVALKEDCPVEVSREHLSFDPARRDVATLRRIYSELGFSRQLAALESAEELTGTTAATESAPAPPPAVPEDNALLLSREQLDSFLTNCEQDERVALEIFTTRPERHQGPVVGLSLARLSGEAVYIPLGHRYVGAPTQLTPSEALSLLFEKLANKKLVVHEKKRQLVLLQGAGVTPPPPALLNAEDTLLGAYLLDPERSHSIPELGERLGRSLPDFEALLKEKRKKRDLDEVALEDALPVLTARVRVLLQAQANQAEQLEAAGLRSVYETVELPLANLLAEMEERGVLIDVQRLQEMSVLCDAELSTLEKQAHEIAGKSFNVNSPRQLETLLFDELGLKPIKRTKTSRSTDAETLEALSEQHELPDVILKIRQIAKLKGTYIDALPALVRPETGRVHGAWEQAVAATGRLSSTEPNLQNIPIRTELGRKIRDAFVAPPGHFLISADYSQIELRVLAHLSQDERLVEAFRTGQDVHTRTAMEIFEVSEEEVTREMRAQAKAVNFGVIYGQGDSGLSKAVGISRMDAARFIAAYFRRYEGVRRFLDSTLEKARQGEAVQSLLGRRRSVPDIKSGNRARRLAAERIAMNMPIQGSAADILKLAMLALQKPVTPGTRMVLTVHDELVFEVPQEEVEEAKEKIRAAMEGVCQLDVPLTVSVGHGLDWNSAH